MLKKAFKFIIALKTGLCYNQERNFVYMCK
jgi:hypothetical protein